MVELYWPREGVTFLGDDEQHTGPTVAEVPDEKEEQYRNRGWEDPPEIESEGGEGDTGNSTGDESDDRDLADLDGVGDAKADALREGGYETLDDLRDVSEVDLANTEGVSKILAERIKADLDNE